MPEINECYNFLVLQNAIGKLYETPALLTLRSSQRGGYIFMSMNFRNNTLTKRDALG